MKGRDWDENCPVVDLHLVTEPLATAREALRCSESEITAASAPRTTGWSFDSSSKFLSEEVTLKSDDMSLYKTSTGKESSHFATLRYSLDVRSPGNALSIVATYPFSEVEMSMALFDEQTGTLTQTDSTSSLEGDKESGTPLSDASDMATYVEVPWLDSGRYRLEIVLRRSLFLPTAHYPTCLAFGLVVEYVTRSALGTPDPRQYEVLSVYPLSLKNLDPDSEKVIDVHFDREIVLDDLVDGPSERLYVCTLVNTQDEKDRIHPRTVRIEGREKLRLDFDFSQARIPVSNRCYALKCSTQ
jgi:hypothetical protein